MHDIAHGAVHFDSKTWRTLPKLLFKPGELTRRYIDGERTRFVSPMALFLFSIFLMFAVFQIAGISAPTDLRGDTDAQLRELAGEQVERLENRRDTLAERIADPETGHAQSASAEEELSELERQLAAVAQAQQELPFLNGPTEEEPASLPEGQSARIETNADSQSLAEVVTKGEDWNLDSANTGWLKKGLEKWQKNPGLMLYKLQTSFYKFSWLLIPLSVPFVWLLFF